MGVIDEFKSEKNIKIIFNAADKMIIDKYNSLNITQNDIMNMIGNTINSICSDAILLNKVVKVMELNKISLSKVKDHLDNIINKQNEIPVEEKKEEEINQDKYDSEQLLLKVLELEEKRSAANSMSSIKQSQLSQKISKPNQPNQLIQPLQPQPFLNDNQTLNNMDINIKILEKIEAIAKDRIEIKYKNIIINSYSRDWDINLNRNKLSFSINVNMQYNIIKPYILILPKTIKNKTPYITMNITDGKHSNKVNYIIKNICLDRDNSWDIWEPLNNDISLLLTEKKWQVYFTDFTNKDLEMGADGINIIEVIDNEDKTFDIKIDNSDIFAFNNFNIELLNNFDNILLKTNEDDDIILKVIKINNNTLTVYNEKINKLSLINATLLNYKAQYSIILNYCYKNIL
jgi:hypothetical protein